MFNKNIFRQLLFFGLLLNLERGFAYKPDVSWAATRLSYAHMSTTQLRMTPVVVDLPPMNTMRNRWKLHRVCKNLDKDEHEQEPYNNKGQGMTRKLSMAYIPGKELLTVGSELTGMSFAIVTFLKGVICVIKPNLILKALGIRDKDREGDGEPVTPIEFMLSILGTLSLAIGLTAGLALRSELSLLGEVPSPRSISRCIGIGVVPYILSIPRFLAMKAWPSKLAVNRKKNVVGGWIISMVVWYLVLFQNGDPWLPLFVLTSHAAILGPVLLQNPTALFKTMSKDEKVTISPEESVVGRLIGVYSCMYAVLLITLRNPLMNALPSVGLTALTGSIATLYMLYGTKDFESSGASSDICLAASAIGLAVASVGLRHFLIT